MRLFVEKYRDILLDVTGNLFILGLISLILHHFTSIIVSVWIDIFLLAIITSTSGFSWFFIFIQKDEEYFKVKTEPYFRNLFLTGLFVIAIGSLTFEFIEHSQLLSSVVSFTSSIQFYLILATIGFGFFTFYFNGDKLEDIGEEACQEKLAEKKREMEFAEKYPRINRVWGVRLIGKWMYREGWWYSTAVIILLIIGFSIRLYRLGELSLWWDEIITGNVVARIMETGLPLEPSGLEYYWRGVAYHYFVAIFAYFFGLTEFAIRFPSVLFGMGIVFLSFLIGKKIDKWLGLLVLIFMTFSTYNVEYSRFARFYVMNSFLFMLSIFIVYKGFFQNILKYKIASLAIFAVMMHTVQFGRFFLFTMTSYFTYELVRLVLSKNKLEVLKQNKINFVFLGFALIILKLDNLFQRLFSSDLIPVHEFMDSVAAPPTYPIIKVPEWDLFKFMDSSHIPIFIILIFFAYFMFILLKNINLEQNVFLTYIGIIFTTSTISFEILNRNVIGPRVFLIFEGLYVILSLYILTIVFKLFSNRKGASNLFGLFVVLLLLISINPSFYERTNINYGDDITNDPFRTTSVAAYRADYKTQYLYLDEHIKDDDISISVMRSCYFYINRTPDYIINQNNGWNTNTILDDKNNFIYPRSGAIAINKVDDIQKIIDNNPNKRVWLLVNGGSINILDTTHVRSDFLQFLADNEDKTVYQSSDRYSRVLLFN